MNMKIKNLIIGEDSRKYDENRTNEHVTMNIDIKNKKAQ